MQAASFSQHKITSSVALCKTDSPQAPKTLNANLPHSGPHSDTRLLSQTMPWEGRGGTAVIPPPARTQQLSCMLPGEQRAAASMLLWRDWNPCLPPMRLQNNHHARRYTRVECSQSISQLLHRSFYPQLAQDVDEVRTCSMLTAVLPWHVLTVVLQTKDATWSWAGRPRDNSSWLTGWPAAAALSCTL